MGNKLAFGFTLVAFLFLALGCAHDPCKKESKRKAYGYEIRDNGPNGY